MGKDLVVTMPDGSQWAVDVMIIARHRAAYYAPREFDGDLWRSLREDTLPLFESDSYEVHDWAANNMNWEDARHAAYQIRPAPAVNYQEGWVNGEWCVQATPGTPNKL
jgi:hypothetical protein